MKLDHRHFLPLSACLYAMGMLLSVQGKSAPLVNLFFIVLATYMLYVGLCRFHLSAHSQPSGPYVRSLVGNYTRSLAEQEQERQEAHNRGEDIRQASFEQEQIAWEVLTKMAEAGSSWRDIEGVSMQLGLMLFMARKSDMETLERIYGKDFYDPLKPENKP